jgi:hypothetical protein
MERRVTVPEYLDAIRDFPDGAFSLFKSTRNIGIGFKNTDANGNVHLCWLRLRDLKLLTTDWERVLMAALRLHEIPPEQCREHPALHQ